MKLNKEKFVECLSELLAEHGVNQDECDEQAEYFTNRLCKKYVEIIVFENGETNEN